jgi:hypothetical protein
MANADLKTYLVHFHTDIISFLEASLGISSREEEAPD